MPEIEINGARLYYEEHGEGDETVVFSHGLLMNSGMFNRQVQALRDRYRCITYDHRGQGRSAVSKDGYDMDNLTRDAASLIRSLGVYPCHFVGMSMGGFVGLRLGIHHPELLQSLTLIDSSAAPESKEVIRPFHRMAFVGRWLGFGLVVDKVMNIMFGKTFMSDPGRAEEREHWRRQIRQSNRKGATRAALGVIDREGVLDEIENISVPTLIIVGEEDIATPPEASREMNARIPNSRLVEIPRAGHSSNIEQAAVVNRTLRDFLGG